MLVGPGQDAGAVDIGDGTAIVFKIESHSHPSAIEPYQGAATGVGGIVRDIVSMGARPVALLDPLMFGPLEHERNRRPLSGVVAGIGGYGNCIGVPTVGGEVRFADPHSANPTVNVMCVGIAEADRLMTAQSHTPQVGSLLVLYGASTGRDGIGGVSVLASATLEDGSEASRPSVQIGDPFTEKLLIEATLELIGEDMLEGLQDLGGAGITCAVSESAARAGMGVRLDLDAVPLRERGMEPFEILTSESQERMLAIVHPSRLVDVDRICSRWGLTTAVIGELVPGGELTVSSAGAVVASVPARSLADDGPEYDRPAAAPARAASGAEDPTFVPFDGDPADALRALLAAPNIASKRWIYEQYDRLVQGNSVAGPDSDAALVRVGTKALALSTDGKGRFGALDPYLGSVHAVAEAARNVAVTGARPLAITNCLNFGDPEQPEVMWQFAESVRGIRDACLALGTPVTGGNVSFYNGSGGSAIDPTPVIGMLGLLADHRLRVSGGFPRPRLASTCSARRSPSSAGPSSRRRCWGTPGESRRRSTSSGSGSSCGCWRRRRRRRSWPARTTAPTAGSRWPSPNARSRAATGSPSRSPATCPRTSRCSPSRPRAPSSRWIPPTRSGSSGWLPPGACRSRGSARRAAHGP